MVKQTPKKRTNKPKVKAAARKQPVVAASLGAYLRMLADPCGSALVRAPYTGTDSGYLIRTRSTFAPSAGTSTGSTNSYMIQWTPAGAATNGFVYRSFGATSYATLSQSDFLTSGAVAKARPVASCLKWVPTGPVTSRQGVVGMLYSTGSVVTSGATCAGTLNDMLNTCNVLASNGSVPHEVKWLPTIADEVYTNPSVSVATEVSGGTVAIVLSGVDSTSGVPNGYIEATTIYEWVPAANQGGAPSVAPASPYTVKDAISKIGDLGQFLFGDSQSAVGGALQRAAGHMVTTMLTGATYMVGRRGAMLSL